MELMGLLFAAAGLFSMCGAIFNWEWFFNARKARPIVAMLGRGGARAFYALLGLAIIVFGVLVTLGMIHGGD